MPSLVGGEVIGSVLVAHRPPLTQPERSRVDESVSQAAPVLANLRNLAVAEVRAATDGLTGLPNARSLRESLVRMVAQAARSELPLSAVLCDLDHFKQINDVYGHEKGDQALAAASAALRAALRESDLAGRYGGEEFLILLPDTPLDGAVVLAEKLRDEVALVDRAGRRPRDHGELRRRLVPGGHAGRRHADPDGGPRALRREVARAQLRRHRRRAARRAAEPDRARRPAPACCRPARRATSARPDASRRPRARRLP